LHWLCGEIYKDFMKLHNRNNGRECVVLDS